MFEHNLRLGLWRLVTFKAARLCDRLLRGRCLSRSQSDNARSSCQRDLCQRGCGEPGVLLARSVFRNVLEDKIKELISGDHAIRVAVSGA
jgi:hypothetical protein